MVSTLSASSQLAKKAAKSDQRAAQVVARGGKEPHRGEVGAGDNRSGLTHVSAGMHVPVISAVWRWEAPGEVPAAGPVRAGR